jgi:hypothetical protein
MMHGRSLAVLKVLPTGASDSNPVTPPAYDREAMAQREFNPSRLRFRPEFGRDNRQARLSHREEPDFMDLTKRQKALVAGTIIFFTIALIVATHHRPHTTWKLPSGPVKPAVGLGFSHGTILAPDGSLWAWGDQELGWAELGLGKISTEPRLRRIGTENDWRAISLTASSHVLALKADGTIWGWGDNLRHQLGPSTNKNCAVPFQCVAGNDWKQVAAGGTQSLGLKNDGTLWAWGINWAGQLGIGNTTDSPMPVQVGSATNWVKVWAGGIQTIAIQADGSLWSWGGDYATSSKTRIVPVPTRVSPDTNWIDIGFGSFMIFGIKSDGTLWAWGREADVFTGVADTNLNATPMQVGTDNDWQACSSSDWNYNVFQKKDGSLWGLDSSEHKIIKPRSQYRPVKFKRIAVDKPIVAFAAGRGEIGGGAGAVLTSEGEVLTWGKRLGVRSGRIPFLQWLANLPPWQKAHHTWGQGSPVIRSEPSPLPVISPGEK